MSCPRHPERTTGLARCVACLQRFCRDCLRRDGQFYYCTSCAPAAAPSPARAASSPARPVTGVELLGSLDPASAPEVEARPGATVAARALAFVIDAVLVGFAALLIASRLESSPGLVLVVMVGLPFLYEALFVQQTGQTLGKAAMGIEVVSADGRPVTDGQAWGRAAVKVVQLGCCGATFLAALFVGDARGVHDHIAGTRVARAD